MFIKKKGGWSAYSTVESPWKKKLTLFIQSLFWGVRCVDLFVPTVQQSHYTKLLWHSLASDSFYNFLY